MINGKTIAVVLPAYNAARTLAETYAEIPRDIVDHIILTDDCSADATVEMAHRLGIPHIIRHDRNRGYGANQKTCYDRALALRSDIIIMLHPDYQYTPRLIHSMAYMLAQEVFPVCLCSRILGGGALRGGMPWYKYLANRALTLFENIMTGAKLSEYHTGYRAFTADVLRSIDYHSLSDDFVFDNQLLAAILYRGYHIGEITCPTRYMPEASSINLRRSAVYALGVIGVSIEYRLAKWHIGRSRIFRES